MIPNDTQLYQNFKSDSIAILSQTPGYGLILSWDEISEMYDKSLTILNKKAKTKLRPDDVEFYLFEQIEDKVLFTLVVCICPLINRSITMISKDEWQFGQAKWWKWFALRPGESFYGKKI
jgi:hypothetical protein